MKKGYLVYFIFLIYNNLSAQSTEKPNTFRNYLGFEVSFNNYTLHGSQIDHESQASQSFSNPFVEHKKNFGIGINFRHFISSNYFIQSGVSYKAKGGYHRSTVYTDPAKVEISYLHIPISVGVCNHFTNYTLGIFSGISSNIELSSGRTSSGEGWLYDKYKRNDLIMSFLSGVFIDYHINTNSILHANINYESDLTPVIKRTLDNKNYTIKIKGFIIAAGLKFPIMK